MNIAQMIKDGEPAVAAAVDALTQPRLRQAGTPVGTAALVQRLRDALAAEPTRQRPYITRAIAEADQWLAEQPAQADPMDWPLPCEVKVGHGTHAKGTKLRSLVARMQALYNTVQAVAQPLTDEQRKWAALGPLIDQHEIGISTPSNRVHRNGGPNAGWGPAGCWGGTAWKHGINYRPVSHSKGSALEVLEELAAKLSTGAGTGAGQEGGTA